MSNILKGVYEAKKSDDFDDDEFDAMVARLGAKAKQQQAGVKPVTKQNPKTGKYYVDYSGQDKKVDETSSTGQGGGSAGIGGGAGLGISKSPFEKILEKPLGEAGYDNDDWGVSKSQFKRRELQHELGKEDEWQRRQEQRPKLVAYVFYDVKPGQEKTAAMYNVKQLKSGKWAMPEYNTSGRSYRYQRENADRAFGPGKRWELPKQQGVAEGDVVSFKKKKSEHEKYADAFSKQHDDTHRYGVGHIECPYCGDVNCDYDCDESQADGFNEHINSPGGMGQAYRKFKPKAAGISQGVAEGVNDTPQSARILTSMKGILDQYVKQRGASGGNRLKDQLIPLLNQLNSEGEKELAMSIMQMIQDAEMDDRRTKGMSWGVMADGLSKHLPTLIQKRLKQGVAEGLGQSTDEILEKLTAAYRSCVKQRDSYTNFGNIQTVYKLLRDPLMQGNIQGYEKAHAYVSGKYPDAFDLLMDEVPGQGVAEEQAPMFTPEDKMVSANNPTGTGWRHYKAVPAGAKESAIMKGLQTEENMKEYELGGTKKIVFSKENPPDLDHLYRQFIHAMLSSENTTDPKVWIDSMNDRYGTGYTWKDYQNRGHKDYTDNWDKIVNKYVLGKGQSDK